MSDNLERRLLAHTYHRPSVGVQDTITLVRVAYMALVKDLDASIPECREKSLTFTALEESAMWAIKALVLTDTEGEVIWP